MLNKNCQGPADGINNKTKSLDEKLRKKLAPHHIKQHCEDRGLNKTWVSANCKSLGSQEAYAKTGHRAKGLFMQGENSMCQLRPDETGSDGRKYLTPSKSIMPYDAMLYRHPDIEQYWSKRENILKHCISIDEHPYVLLTEGLFKAICCGQNGIACIALAGVTMGQVGKGDDEARPLVPSLQRIVGLGIGIIIAFDADSARNFSVRRAHKTLAEKLEENGVRVRTVTGLWDEKHGKGLDDYVQKRGWEAFLNIIKDSITNEDWNNKFPVFKGVEFHHSIEMTIANSLFYRDWAVIDDVFYQYQISADGELGFYQKIRNCQVKKKIGDKLKTVYKIKYVPGTDSKGNQIEKPIPVYSFATQRHKQSVFQFCQTDLYVKTPANEHLIPFLNGTLDTRTGELQDHSRNNYLTWNIPHDYKATSQCPKNFHDFILKAFGAEYFELIQAIFSMYLDSTAPYGYFIHIMGRSGSGKGTLLRLLASLFNTDNVMATGSFDELSHYDKRHQLLTGKRLCYFPDVQGFQGGLTSFYELIDNGIISGRALNSSDGYAKRWNVRFAIASVSHLGIENAGTGWDRRCIPLPTKPRQGAIDTELFDKLSDEKPQIISWALSIKRDRRDYLIKNSNVEFAGIRELKAQAAIYSDSMKGFIDQCLEPAAAESQTLTTDALFSAYRAYCHSTGLKPTAQNKLISRLAEEIPQFLKPRTTRRHQGQKYNIPKHFFKIAFSPNIFQHKDGDWHCDRAFLTEGNMQLFEYLTQAEQSDSGIIKEESLYLESAETTTNTILQLSDSTDSTDSGSKTNFHMEKKSQTNVSGIKKDVSPSASHTTPNGDSGINNKKRTVSCLSQVNTLSQEAEATAVQEIQPTPGTEILGDSPLSHPIHPESVGQSTVENSPTLAIKNTEYAEGSDIDCWGESETEEATSVETHPTEATKNTLNVASYVGISVGDIVGGKDPESVSYNWRGIVIRVSSENPEVVYVDYPEREELYKCGGKNKRVISVRRSDLRKIDQ